MSDTLKAPRVIKEADLEEWGIPEINIRQDFKDLLYPLRAEQRAALKATVERDGLLAPVDIDEGGTILDGHHRYEICKELQVHLRYRVNRNLSEEEKKELIYSRNMDRRQISPEQQREVLATRLRNLLTLREKNPNEFTYEEIGRRLNIDESTVRKFENRKGPVGKRVDARVKVPKDQWPRIKQRHDEGETFNSLAADFGVTKSTIKAIYDKENGNEQRRAFLAEAAEDFQDRMVDLRLGDFAEVFEDIADGAVDAIITDPPYEKDALEEWSKLGQLAARVLSPDGWLVAYTGHYYLPEVLNRLTQHLDYYWLGMVHLKGDCKFPPRRNVRVLNRPFLICRRKDAPQPTGNAFVDTIEGGDTEKTYHPWQQSLKEFEELVQKFSDEGTVVMDPFVGSGTTLIAARRLGRVAIGAEIDPKTYEVALGRIAVEVGDLDDFSEVQDGDQVEEPDAEEFAA